MRRVPKLSVLLPVYNCEQFLEEAIASIIGQTYADFELVIVNDGSTDRSLEIVKRCSSGDPRIVIINQPNAGIAVALNVGLVTCRGEYIARMDGDDISMPRRLELQAAFLDAHPTVGVVGTWAEVINSQNGKIGILKPPEDHADIVQNSFIYASTVIIHPSSMIRRAALDQVGMYDRRYEYAEDTDLFFRIAKHWRLANIQSVLLKYRRHSNSISSLHRSRSARLSVEIVKKARTELLVGSRSLVAGHCYRASWLSANDNHTCLALKYALMAFLYNPLSLLGPRALARTAWTFVTCFQSTRKNVDPGYSSI